MTYPLHIRKKILAELEYSTYRAVAERYNISTTALQNWKKQPVPKTNKNYPPRKIDNQALIQDVEQYPDDYQWQRAARFGCGQSAIFHALKRLNITLKKTLEHPKADQQNGQISSQN